MTLILLCGLSMFCGFGIGCLVMNTYHERHCKDCQADQYDVPQDIKNMISPTLFLSAVSTEITRARKKHPGNAHLTAALMEEVGELSKALLEDQGAIRVWIEATHVACVASRIAIEGDGDFDKLICKPVFNGTLPDMDETDTSFSLPPSRVRSCSGQGDANV